MPIPTDATLQDIILAVNHDLINGTDYSPSERDAIINILLSSASDKSTVSRFHRGVRAYGDDRAMYPSFYIPPYNGGKKFPIITGYTPKTHILSANHYELEILRLFALWKPDDSTAVHMLHKTKERLAATCFGKFCPKGECFEASIVTLRFLTAAFPDEESWILKLLDGIESGIERDPNGKKRHSGIKAYYSLTLSDMKHPNTQLSLNSFL